MIFIRMVKLIINADDFGANPEVNLAIERMISGGYISSATIMANGEAFEDTVRIVNANRQVSFGVHLNLDEYHSLTRPGIFRERGITDNQDIFIKNVILKKKSFDRELKKAIYYELHDQVRRVQQAGIPLTHFDSHHHFHTQPLLSDILKQLGHDFSIRKIRRPLNKSKKYLRATRMARVQHSKTGSNVHRPSKNKALRKINSALSLVRDKFEARKWNHSIKNYFITTDAFMTYAGFYHYCNSPYAMLNAEIIELMCHPGHKAYDFETELLEEQKLAKLIDFQLVSFHDL